MGSLLLRSVAVVGAWFLIVLVAGPSAQADTGNGTTPTIELAAAGSAEPLTDADRELLVKVRLAGLWEMPAGQMAAKKGVSPRVREVGTMISSQHKQLDALVVKAAQQAGVELPNEPNADQQGWLAEMRAASGPQFDDVFVQRLRAAHGKVFPVIANVRAGTRNTIVRQLAQQANGFVLTHLTLLESTGIVDYSGLPQAQASTATPTPKTEPVAATTGVASSSSMVGLTVTVALLLTVPLLLRWLVRRRLAGAQVPPYPGRQYPPEPLDAYEGHHPYAFDGYRPAPPTPPRPSRLSPPRGVPLESPGERPRRLQPTSRRP